jgi:class 3 adenylate cyclase/tetratricopeptide (TPR) repeat protein
MATCPACGHENRDGAKFCEECATPLGTPARPVAEERKVVTALFCDLVGFTATSEAADPEDVDRMLTAYAAMARERIEAYGGVVEKFIGDAVVGIFGVPAAHEDDPERAVRAALRIAEDAAELEAIGGAPLTLRIGINTGETLVRLGVVPGSGERMLAGDAINTASRIQSVAPEMGVAVGLDTYAATSQVFDYQELEAATLKGKSEPVRIFHAKAPLARFGADLTRTHDSPFIGREIDLALLKGIFDKAVAADAPQLVTVVGEPGLGKSRIAAELFAHLDARSDLITWRQGRCLPYGEGITFWALGEILKAHAGILESDPPEVATAKLNQVLPDGPERAWFRERLLPLLGIEAASTAGREELFTAWRRFLEHVAERGPTVLVFEDLHWADDAMLAFLEHLADRAEAVPLLVIGTARPELHELHPGFASGLVNVNVIRLAPLSEVETARLVSALLESTVIPAELQRPILERAGGNPLYAEEFVRLLRDRDLLTRTGSSWELREGAEVPFPDSVQALIAARLDTLSADTKSMLADAAVVGKVFWAGAIAQMGDRDLAEVTDSLHDLSRKELVRSTRRSSIEGEAEYAFWHVLARDVAYGQLPRISRASRHVAAARWLESRVPDRVEDLADVLAYHYATALDLADAAGEIDRVGELEAPARRFLVLAGERALGLDTTAALGNLERALALTPPDHPQRPEVLTRFGEAAQHGGRTREAVTALEEAIALFSDRGEVVPAARGMLMLSRIGIFLGDPRGWTLPHDALRLVEPLGAAPELVEALGEVAATQAILGKSRDALDVAGRAIALADELGLPRQGRILGYRGIARADLGDPGGLQDLRDAFEISSASGAGREAALALNNLATELWGFEGPAASLAVLREGIAFGRARGIAETVEFQTAGTVSHLFGLGAFDEALAVAEEVEGRLEEVGSLLALGDIRCGLARIWTFRGELERAIEACEWLERTVPTMGNPELLCAGLAAAAIVRAALGQRQATSSLLERVDGSEAGREKGSYAEALPGMVRAAVSIGDANLAARLVEGVEPRLPATEHALVAAHAVLAEAAGDLRSAAQAYADAARRWEAFTIVPEQAFALLGQGRCLLELSRPAEAEEPLRHAREILERSKATPVLAEAETLLERATALSS